MAQPHPHAERIRALAFQPLADTLDAWTGTNCFDAAAALLATNAFGDVAYQTHLVTTGDPAAHGPLVLLLHVALWTCDARMSRGLRAFSRMARDDGRLRFHPHHRAGTWLALAVMVALGVGAARDVLTSGLPGPHWSGWEAFGYAYCMAFPVALFLAACEWRRRPPARSRGHATAFGAA